MSNDFYNHSGSPAQGSPGSSQVMRDEFATIQVGFDKMPGLSGNAGKRVQVNGTGTGLAVGTASEMRFAAVDQVISASTSFSNDEALGGFEIIAGGLYRVDGLLVFEATSETPDLKMQFVAPDTLQVHEVKILFNDANNTNNPETVLSEEGVSSERLGLSTTEPNILWLNGLIQGNASLDTTWRLQWAQFQSHASDVTRKAGSHIELTRLA